MDLSIKQPPEPPPASQSGPSAELQALRVCSGTWSELLLRLEHRSWLSLFMPAEAAARQLSPTSSF